MTIEYRSSGSLFDPIPGSPHPWLVCPVNTVPGVMGAGLAREFTKRWPELPWLHANACRGGTLTIGRCVVKLVGDDPQCIPVVLFPTKNHWRDPSRLNWIEMGLKNLARWVREVWESPPVTIAMPALGCGLGSLSWDAVRPLIEATANDLPRHRWIVWEPANQRRASQKTEAR